jgi:hypothetical protein
MLRVTTGKTDARTAHGKLYFYDTNQAAIRLPGFHMVAPNLSDKSDTWPGPAHLVGPHLPRRPARLLPALPLSIHCISPVGHRPTTRCCWGTGALIKFKLDVHACTCLYITNMMFETNCRVDLSKPYSHDDYNPSQLAIIAQYDTESPQLLLK